MKNLLALILVINFSLWGSSQQELTIVNIDNDSSFLDLSILDSVNDVNRLFFSGENHAFQKSNLKLELKLLKYFHQNHQVNTLLLEFGVATGWLTNEFVKTGREDLKEAIKTQFSENFLDYFVKIKEYNDSLPASNKIKIVGIDLQRSFPLGFEVLHFLLPSDSVFPNDSIMKEIELIKFLQGYNKKRLNKEDEEEDGYFRGKSYSNFQSMKALLDNYKKFKPEYKTYLGDNFETFDEIMECSEKSYYYKSEESQGTPMGLLFREDYMYKKLNSIALENKNDKYYGQFGRSHTLKNVSSDGYAHNFSSLVAKIDKFKTGELYDKVISIGIYYVENADENTTVFYQDSDVEHVILGELEDFPADSIGILKVEGNSKIDSVLNNNYEYIIVHNGSYVEEVYDMEAEFDFYGSEVVESLDFFYGNYNLDMSGAQDYFGVSFRSPIQFFGFGFSNLSNSFYFDYEASFFFQETFTPSDSLALGFSGWNVFFNAGYDVLKTRKIDLIPAVGVGYQSIKMKITQSNISTGFDGVSVSNYEVKNPAFVMDFSGKLRVRLIKDYLALSLKYGYRLDFSDDRWRFEKGKIDGAKTNMSGTFAQFSISFGSF